MTESTKFERLLSMNQQKLRVPLSWVATTEAQPCTNFGDGLSAVIVSALAGIPVQRANFDENSERMVAVGTIGHGQKNGILHFWGTGIDADRNPITGDGSYSKPPQTEFHIYATRGPNTAATFQNAGILAPDVYGDPVWLLPHIWPLDDVEKEHELGIILHISELTSQDAFAGPLGEYLRYAIPEEWIGKIHIINTYAEPTPDAMRAKVSEILSCKRILSTSLHGLVISETYKVPCAWFATYGTGEGLSLDLEDPDANVDHRIRDFYRGLGAETIIAYCRDRGFETDWTDAISFIDENWRSVQNYDEKSLINAFPLPLSVSADEAIWTIDPELLSQVQF